MGLLGNILGRNEKSTLVSSQQGNEFNEDAKDIGFKASKLEFLQYVSASDDIDSALVKSEMPKLVNGRGKLTFDDYVYYGLYNRPDLSLEQKQAFISDNLHWKVAERVGDKYWRLLTEDKFLSYSLLEGYGYRVPNSVAVVDSSDRHFPNTEKFNSAAELAAFGAKSKTLPWFCKPNLGIAGLGAFTVERIENGIFHGKPYGTMTADELDENCIRGRTLLVQQAVQNHSEVAKFANAVATIRITNFIIDGELQTPPALIKIPAGDHIADNFHAAGNMVANIDLESGMIDRVVRGVGMEMELLSKHPDNDAQLVGVKLPHWQEAKKIAREVGMILSPLKFNSLDIALTNEGPLIIEVNTAGSLALPQLASGTGLINEKTAPFFGV